MFFQTRLDEQTWILIDSVASGAFAKNETETQMSPELAMQNIIDISSKIGVSLSKQLEPAIAASPGLSIEMVFSMLTDASGNVMVGATTESGQFRVTVRCGQG